MSNFRFMSLASPEKTEITIDKRKSRFNNITDENDVIVEDCAGTLSLDGSNPTSTCNDIEEHED